MILFDQELIIHQRPRSLFSIAWQARELVSGLFFPHLADLQVDKVEDLGNAVLVTARSRLPEAACHRCGLSSARVNSRVPATA
jgi:hypothetical protein